MQEMQAFEVRKN